MLVFVMDVCESFNKNPLMDPNLAPPFMKQRRMDWQNEVYQVEKNNQIKTKARTNQYEIQSIRINKSTTDRNLHSAIVLYQSVSNQTPSITI